jgi:hypothetical protein
MKAAMEFIGSLKICSDRALVPYTAYATIIAEVHAKEKLPNLEVPLLTIQTMLENAGMASCPPRRWRGTMPMVMIRLSTSLSYRLTPESDVPVQPYAY